MGKAKKNAQKVAVKARVGKALTEKGGSDSDAKKAALDATNEYFDRLSTKAAQFAKHAKRKRILQKDIELAKKHV